MQTLPVLKKFDSHITLPVIHFYNKTTFNTYLTRHLEQQLISASLPDYLPHLKSVMKPLGKFKKLIRKNGLDIEQKSEQGTQLLVDQTQAFSDLTTYLDHQLNSGINPATENLILSYLSNFMGKISRERSGQESVFHWLDVAIKNGLSNILEDYELIYQPWLRPGLNIVL
jgi:hypothetical protein